MQAWLDALFGDPVGLQATLVVSTTIVVSAFAAAWLSYQPVSKRQKPTSE